MGLLVVMNLNASLACIKLLNNIFQFFVKYKNFACHIFNVNFFLYNLVQCNMQNTMCIDNVHILICIV